MRRKSHGGGGPLEDLDTQTQLLINYARVDAAAKKSTTRKPHLNATAATALHPHHRSSPTPPIEFKSVNSILPQSPSGVVAALTNAVASTSFIEGIDERNGGTGDENQNTNDNNNNDDEDDDNYSDDVDNSIVVDERQQQFMRHALLSLLLLNRRRRYSWPRCRHDNLQFNNFNREVRSFLFQQHYHYDHRHHNHSHQHHHNRNHSRSNTPFQNNSNSNNAKSDINSNNNKSDLPET